MSSLQSKVSGKVLLAVSGGMDSMVMLYAAVRSSGPHGIVVATFDHGTGEFAKKACEVVQTACNDLGVVCRTGGGGGGVRIGTREAEWRDARWRFLRQIAAEEMATIFTAHTLDDQIETVVMRVLRGAGARGLAGLYAESDVVRPLIGVTRRAIEAYALRTRVPYINDPSNQSRAHLRNRVRLDLLPALNRAHPGFSREMLAISQQAADWRLMVDSIVNTMDITALTDGSLTIARKHLEGFDSEQLRVLWPAIAARSGVVMDRRGTHRLAEFTMRGRTGGVIQLSGGVEVLMRRDHMLLRRFKD